MPVPVVLAAALLCVAQAPNSPRPMSFIDVLSVPGLSDPQLSPDARTIAFVEDRPDWAANKRIGHLFTVPGAGGPAVQLTRGTRGESSPRWSPDGRTLAFLARRDEEDDNQVHLLPLDGGEARALTTHASAVSAIAWSPDGSRIYFLADEAKSVDERARETQKEDVFRFDENYRQRHLWYVTVATGHETRVTTGDFSILSFRLSEDGRQIAAERAPTPLLGDAELGEVVVISADGGDIRALTANGVAERGATFSPDGRSLLFLAGANERFEGYYQSALFTVPVAGGAARLVAPDFPYEVEDAEWESSTRVLALVNMGVHSELFELDLANPSRPRQITDGEHSIAGWSYSRGLRRSTFLVEEPTRPGDIWTLGEGDAKPTRASDELGYLIKDFQVARQERVEWTAPDGQKVEGLLFYPTSYTAGQRYPLVVQTHGGPAASDQYGWGGRMSYAQVLAGKGYAVLRPNYRGSTGYGNPFLRDMVGAYFRHAHLDVLAGVDALVSRGIADPDRLIAMGWSAGGHMTNKLVTFTDRFKAASSGAGAADWVSMYAQSDIRTYRTPWFGGTPWQANAPIDVYWEQSPLKYVSAVKTPTLFFVGQDDPRVPMPQSVEMYRALKSLKVPTRLYVAPREGHGWSELRHQLAKYNAEMWWFEHYVRGTDFAAETAPATGKSDQPRPLTVP